MDENNVTNDASDSKGLSDEGIDIISETTEPDSPEEKSKETEDISPVFPEDSGQNTAPAVDLDALEKQEKSDREKLAIVAPINKLETPRSAPMAQK
jgi:mannose-1-phosphate guanylyltransferase